MRFFITGKVMGSAPLGAVGVGRQTPAEALAVVDDYLARGYQVTVTDGGASISVEQLRQMAKAK